MARNSISARERFQIGQLLQREWALVQADGRTMKEWAQHASETLGFLVTGCNVRNVAEMIGVTWKKSPTDAVADLTELVATLEARVAKLEAAANSKPAKSPTLPFTNAG